jgi:hypothetical protein
MLLDSLLLVLILLHTRTQVPFQGFGTVTPLPTGAINIQVPPAAIPIHQQLLPDPAAAGPSDPGQWGWKCAVTDQDIVQYEQLKLDLDTYMADCVKKSIMCCKHVLDVISLALCEGFSPTR